MAKPIVNGIEKDLKGQAKVVRLNLLSKLGRELARAYGVTAIPATIVFDGAGRMRHSYQGVPNRQRIVGEVNQLGG
jgi:thioredoxin-like negative regulator of GroEL